MLAACRRLEYNALDRGPNEGPPGGPRWEDVSDAHDDAVRVHPRMQAHFAVARLLRSLALIDRDRLDASATAVAARRHGAATARQDAAFDPDNLLVRLTLAVIEDAAAPPPSEPQQTPEARFERMKATVESDRPAEAPTFYNVEFLKVWYEVLGRYIHRSDTAASLATAIPRYLIRDQFEALPVLERRLTELADELEAAGHGDAAATCRRWFGQLMLGLLVDETEAGTRLLCADLLARSLEERLRQEPSSTAPHRTCGSAEDPGAGIAEAPPRAGKNAAVAANLRRLIGDFHRAVVTAPPDVADQSFTARPSLAPTAYRKAFYSLATACLWFILGAGATAVLLLVGLAAILGLLYRAIAARRRGSLDKSPKAPADRAAQSSQGASPDRGASIRRGAAPSNSAAGSTGEDAARKRGRLSSVAAAAAAFAIAFLGLPAGLAVYLDVFGLYSLAWALVAGSAVLVVGALLVVVQASSWRTRFDAKSADAAPPSRRRWVVALLFLLTIAACFVPPRTIARWARPLELAELLPWVIGLCALACTILAIAVAPASLRRIAASAARTWFLAVALALVALVYHRSADRQYEQVVTRCQFDEVAARLGPDWQDRYLRAAFDACDVSKP